MVIGYRGECERVRVSSVRAYLLVDPGRLVSGYRASNAQRRRRRASELWRRHGRGDCKRIRSDVGGAICASETAAPAHSPRASLSRPTVLVNFISQSYIPPKTAQI